MAVRYSAEILLHLRESPLCVKPPNLPHANDWMGERVDQPQATRTTQHLDRPRQVDNPLLDQAGRRPALDRHVSRTSTNAEDIVFAPPRMAFASARSNKSVDHEGGLKETDNQGRFNLRSRNGDGDSDRFRDGRNTNPLRRRGDGDQDNEGWSTVKPRKSFGHEGAERFQGRMGGNFREKDEKRVTRDRDDRDAPRDRLTRGSSDFVGRNGDGDDADGGRPRNTSGRSKLELWTRGGGGGGEPTAESPVQEQRQRPDRTKSWRDRDREAEAMDGASGSKLQDRRWVRDRDQRVEREPEWLDEPNEGQREAHTQQDFQKWMEQMKKAKSGASAQPTSEAVEVTAAAIIAEQLPVQSAPAVETGPDKFFMAFGGNNTSSLTPTTPIEQRDVPAKSKPLGKSSRFTSFFAQPHEEVRTRTEPPTPLTGLPLSGLPLSGLPFDIGSNQPGIQQQPVEEERQAFQQLLAKLQKQTMSATPPAPSPFQPPSQEPGRKSNITSPESFAQYGGGNGDNHDGPFGRPPTQNVHEILAPRPQTQAARPEQLLQDLVGHHQRTSSHGSNRADHGPPRSNSNTEFLMNLMRAGNDGQQRPDQQMQNMMRMPQPQGLPQQQGHAPHLSQGQAPLQMPLGDRDAEFGRDSRGPGPRQMRPQPPPGFPLMEEPFHGGEHDAHQRPNQPTQILQRPPPPPGLDQMPPNWMPGGQIPPHLQQQPGPQQQQRGPVMPPPGLPGGQGRHPNVPPPHMFPPNFPPGAMPPPEVLAGLPPRNMPPPPPGFFAGPPHGFIPPGLPGFNGPPGAGMDGHGFPGGPFEGRGMPPAANPNRGAGYGRL